MAKVDLSDILELSVDDRIRLAQDIWDTVRDGEAAIPLTDEQRAELEERLRQHAAHPEDAADWKDVQARMRALLDK